MAELSKMRLLALSMSKLTYDGIVKEVEDAVNENESELVDLNIFQMRSGKMPDGKDISPGYTPKTKSIKKLKGQVFSHVTLNDEGIFQGKMYFATKKFPFRIDSTDVKTDKITGKYGDVFGPSKDSISKAHDTKESVLNRVKGFFRL